VGRRLRCDRSEECVLATQDAEITDAVAALGDCHREVAQDDSGIVGRAALAGRRHRLRKRLGEAGPVGQLAQEKYSCMRDKTFAVRRDFYLCVERSSFHLPGVLLGSPNRSSQTAFSRAGRTFPGGSVKALLRFRGLSQGLGPSDYGAGRDDHPRRRVHEPSAARG
jgi:hypothetical protein